MDQLEQRENR